jgi:hypothetical protein
MHWSWRKVVERKERWLRVYLVCKLENLTSVFCS